MAVSLRGKTGRTGDDHVALLGHVARYACRRCHGPAIGFAVSVPAFL